MTLLTEETLDPEIQHALDVLIERVPGLTADQATWALGFQEGFIRGFQARK